MGKYHIMIDIVFCSIPYSNIDTVYSAPAVLKGVVEQHGYSAKTKDFGVTLYELCEYDVDVFYDLQQYFITGNYKSTLEKQQILDKFYQTIIDFFKNNPSKYIGISVFSFYSHKAALEICQRIRNENITSTIIVGGRGLVPTAYSTLYKEYNIRGKDKLLKFGDLLKSRQLADTIIYGDGEDAILNFLHPTPKQFNECAIPDYTDYELNKYYFSDNHPVLPITGSKGCVRECDFCDVKHQFGRYTYRSGTDVAKEMIALSDMYGIRKFKFTDSLVNGGYRPFVEFLKVISDYNLKNADKRLSWSGQYICRPENEIPKNLYQLIRDSGGEGLTIGAESGSNHVLDSMNKKTTVEALFYELENFRKYGLTCVILTFVGHWSEEYEHFVEHCKMLVDLTPYIRSGTISGIATGHYLLLDGTPSSMLPGVVQSDSYKEMAWLHLDNPSNTIKERIYRKLIVTKLTDRLKFPLVDDKDNLTYITDALTNYADDINNFYMTLETVRSDSRAKETFENFDLFFKSLIDDKNKIKMELELEAFECNGLPRFEISINKNTVFDEILKLGTNTITLSEELKNLQETSIEFSMTNKLAGDTLVGEDGTIQKDKAIIIKQILINGYDIVDDIDLYREKLRYIDSHGNTEQPLMGFWKNIVLSLKYAGNFAEWFNKNSNKNSKLSNSMELRDNNTDDQMIKVIESINRLKI
jgi:hypothetical protein